MVNREHKDRLFRKIFGYEKENLLSLYNALNGTGYTNIDDLTITTIDDVIYMGMKNDVSCIIDDKLTLIEHQSTVNNNMPLRGLLYFGKLYSKYLTVNEYDIHVEKLIKIPTPQYFVLYNGMKEQPDRQMLKLSDAFIQPVKDGIFEWSVIVLNINDGHNEELLNACKLLDDYAKFVAFIRKYKSQGYDTEKAVNMAIDDCIKNDILRDYLLKHKSEVIEMCITEFNQELYAKRSREYYMEEGIERGKIEVMISLLKENLPLDLVARTTGFTTEQIEEMRRKYVD